MRRVTEIHARKPRAIWKQNIIESTYGDIVPTTQELPTQIMFCDTAQSQDNNCS